MPFLQSLGATLVMRCIQFFVACSAKDAETADMTKNTIKKLSAIINERDVEIEALKQKNDSLVSILQTPNGAQPDGEILFLLFLYVFCDMVYLFS